MRAYIALIQKNAESDYGVSFPDLPGCITAGRTLDEAQALAGEVLGLHLEGVAQDGETAPEPSSLEAIMGDTDNRDAVAILVPVKGLVARAVHVDVTLSEEVLARIDAAAEQRGMDRSGFLEQAAKRALENA